MAEVTMPRLSDTMQEGKISKWVKQPGDSVKRGDVLAEIETDKATMELEAYEDGVLQEIIIGSGQTAPIGHIIALVGDGKGDGGGASTAPSSAQAAQTSSQTPAPKPDTGEHKAVETKSDDKPTTKASPLARRVAQEYDIDISDVEGTGPGGRVIRENVEDYHEAHPSKNLHSAHSKGKSASSASSASTAPATATTAGMTVGAGEEGFTPLNRMRRAIAHHMTESKNGTPHIYMVSEVDMAGCLALRKEINESKAASVKISVNDMIIKAVARALHEYPIMNSSYAVRDDGEPGIVEHEHVNVAVAVAVDDGLIVPVVRDADQKSLGTIAAEVKELASHARDGTMKQSQLEGGTFTVSNLGMFDVVEFAAIITPPQAGILAVSSLRQVPAVRDGEIVVAEVMSITLSADHRVTDGATVARFLQRIKRLMELPLNLVV
jgi:pyruvate dehydrogenase E2 component (dihydrolipoamide acetyltransferase)